MRRFGVLPRVHGLPVLLAFLAAGLAVSPAAASAASLTVTPESKTTFYLDENLSLSTKAVVSGTADNSHSYLSVYAQRAAGGCSDNATDESAKKDAQGDQPDREYQDFTPAGSFSVPVSFPLSAYGVGSYVYCAYLDGTGDGGSPAPPSASVTATAGPVSLVHSATVYTTITPGHFLLAADPQGGVRAPYVVFAGELNPVRFTMTVTLSAASAKAAHITKRKLQSVDTDLARAKCTHGGSALARTGVTFCLIRPRLVSHANAVKIRKLFDRGKNITATYDYTVTLSTGKKVQNVQTVQMGDFPPSGTSGARIDRNNNTVVLYGQFPFDYTVDAPNDPGSGGG